MATDVRIPEIGESITEAVLVEWLKKDGERIEANEPLCLLETEKANAEMPSPAAGIVKRLKKEGETVRVGDAIARIEETEAATREPEKPVREGEAPAKPSAAAAAPPREVEEKREEKPEEEPEPEEEREREPAYAAVAEDEPVAEKVEKPPPKPGPEREEPAYWEAAPPPPWISPEEPAVPSRDGEEPERVVAPPREKPEKRERKEAEGVRRVAMSKIRRRIAERLVAAQHTAAMLSTFNEIDMTAVLDLRARYKERFEKMHGASLGLVSFFARACVLALKDFPDMNATIEGTDIVYYDYVNLGIAVSTDRGLVVPVLRNVERMSFAQIEMEIKRAATAARAGKLSIPELSGGTFTITNGGVFGSLLSTPILNPPQTGILGMHAIQKRPVAIEERVKIRPMMYVALTYDHRLVDGKESVSFLVRIKEILEDPARMVLGI